MSETLGAFDNSQARESLENRNQLLQAQSLIRSTQGLREKYERLLLGKSRHETQFIRDPSRPSSWIKLRMSMVDGAVQYVWEMDDSKIWKHCEDLRKIEAENKKNGIPYTSWGAQWFVSTFMLELYLLLRYGIDLRDQEWQDPQSEDGRRLAKIIDNDQFAMRYKTTTMCESKTTREVH